MKKENRLNYTGNETCKRIYKSPKLIKIELDNQISLALESVEPPFGPGEDIVSVRNFFKTDCTDFKV